MHGMKPAYLKVLHYDDVEYFAKLIPLAFEAAKVHDIPLAECEPKKRPQTGIGVCYVEERRISIAVRDKRTHAWGGGWSTRRYSHEGVLQTIAHEIAHIRFKAHGKLHHALELEILATLKEIEGKSQKTVDTLMG